MDRFDEARQRIKDTVDLVELVQEYTAVKRRGRLFVALCPFHAEKTPSFTIYPESQHYKCYGCGQSGDVFSFVMEREGIDFTAAMEMLGERAGVSVAGVFRRGARGDDGPDVHAILGDVRDWCVGALHAPEGRQARDYLADRGLLPAAESFALGFHPARPGALRAFARERGLPARVLQDAGLLGRSGREVLAGRVVFPILDERGRVVGFGGRVLPGAADAGPKYLNSPESPFFRKRRLLYGLRQVKQAGTREIVVVEGYTDVIACHLAGFTGAVATLGTALTTDHARVLERYATDGVVLLFDGDRAGRQAADRAFRELVNTSLPVRIALLPDGVDPADTVGVRPGVAPREAEAGRARLRELIATAPDALTVWFRLVRQRLDLSVPQNVERVARECARILSEVAAGARREALRAAMARHLGLSEAALADARVRPRPRAPTASAPAVRPPESARWTPLEEADLDLLACVLQSPELADRTEELGLEQGPLLTIALALVQDARRIGRAEGPEALARHLFAALADRPRDRRFLSDALDRASRLRDPRIAFESLVAGRIRHDARRRAERARQELQDALASGDAARADRLTREYTDLLRRAAAQRS